MADRSGKSPLMLALGKVEARSNFGRKALSSGAGTILDKAAEGTYTVKFVCGRRVCSRSNSGRKAPRSSFGTSPETSSLGMMLGQSSCAKADYPARPFSCSASEAVPSRGSCSVPSPSSPALSSPESLKKSSGPSIMPARLKALSTHGQQSDTETLKP